MAKKKEEDAEEPKPKQEEPQTPVIHDFTQPEKPRGAGTGPGGSAP